MKILKRINGFGEVFDTEHPDKSEPSTAMPGPEHALHQHHHSTDLAFLRQYFPEGHRIFIRFEHSYFYLITQ